MFDFISFDGFFFANMIAVAAVFAVLMNKKALTTLTGLVIKHSLTVMSVMIVIIAGWTAYSFTNGTEGTTTAMVVSLVAGFALKGRINAIINRAARIGNRVMATMVAV